MNNYNTEKEIWKDIEGFESIYQVSSIGRVKRLAGSYGNNRKYSVNEDKILSLEKMAKGYERVQLNYKPKRRRVLIHVLVAETFLGKQEEPYLQVNHKNGDKADNRVENLEWVTGSENVRHAFENGLNTIRNGEDNPSSKLTERDVRIILRLSAFNKLNHEEIGKVFDVSKSTINHVVSGKNWGYLCK